MQIWILENNGVLSLGIERLSVFTESSEVSLLLKSSRISSLELKLELLISESTYEKTKFAIQSIYKGEIKLSSINSKIKVYQPMAILKN